MQRWVIETATGRFLFGGLSFPSVTDPGTQILVSIDDDVIVDPARERYDTAVPKKRRASTQLELDADATIALDALADTAASVKEARATIRWVMRFVSGSSPTAPAVQTEVERWKTIFRALP